MVNSKAGTDFCRYVRARVNYRPTMSEIRGHTWCESGEQDVRGGEHDGNQNLVTLCPGWAKSVTPRGNSGALGHVSPERPARYCSAPNVDLDDHHTPSDEYA